MGRVVEPDVNVSGGYPPVRSVHRPSSRDDMRVQVASYGTAAQRRILKRADGFLSYARERC